MTSSSLFDISNNFFVQGTNFETTSFQCADFDKKLNMNKSLLLKVLLLRKVQKRRKRKPREMSIRPIFVNRNIRGASTLVTELQDDPYYHNRYFRMKRENFVEILTRIESRITHPPNHSRPISPTDRLAITIRYLATGNSQMSIGFDFRVSPSAVCLILRETMQAICSIFGPEQLPSPTEAHWRSNEKKFASSWNFPNACGALDGKHVRILAPAKSGSLYYNYKNFFSIVLLAIAGPNYVFSAVDIGSSGSQSDGGILTRSTMGKRLFSETFNLPLEKKLIQGGPSLPHVILGDDGFPLKPYLMRPFKGNWLDKSHRIFNYRLSRARMVVENAFGILAARWRIFRTMLDADVELVKLIVMTTVVLHNFLIRKNDMNSITVDREEDGIITEGNWRAETRNDDGLLPISSQGSNNFSKDAAKIRDEFLKYVISDAGKLSWQDRHVTN